MRRDAHSTFGRCMPLAVLAALVSLLAIAPAASASHAIGGLIGGPFGPAAGQFTQARDVAYYQGTDGDPATDKLLVLEGGGQGHRVDVLDRHGNFERMWGRDVLGGNNEFRSEVCTVAQLALCQVGDPASGSQGGEFEDATAIAVNQQTGHVFVRDRDNLRVQEFDLQGNFIRAFGWDVVVEGTTHDSPTDELETCFIAAECKAGSAGSGLGQFAVNTSSSANGTGIAVDPVNGNVFAADNTSTAAATANRRVQEFSIPASDTEPVAFVEAIGVGGTGANQFNTNMPGRLAVDANHVLYAADTTGSGRIHRYDAEANAFLAPIASPPLLAGGTGVNSTSGLEVDPASGNLYVLRDPSSGETVIQEIAEPGGATPTEVTPRHGVGAGFATVTGLGYDPVRDEFQVSIASGNHALLVLAESPGPLTDVEVEAPSGIEAEGATLHGSLDANTGVARWQFEVSTNGIDFEPAGDFGYVSGSGSTQVSAVAEALRPNTLYRVRLRATKQTGLNTATTILSSEDTFSTDAIPAEAETLPATAIRSTSAALQASVDPNGSQTTYRFQYGTTTGYGASVPAVPASAGAGADPILVSEPLTGLDPETTYHFRVVADNGVEVSPGDSSVEGADMSFTTRAVASPPGRGFELVSPAYKEGGQGVGQYLPGDLAADRSGFAAVNADRYMVEANAGSILLDGAFAYASDFAFAERASDSEGWVSRSPFTRPDFGEAFVKRASPFAVSEDFAGIVWAGEGLDLDLFSETETWPATVQAPAIGDWQGRYEVIGPIDPAQGDGKPSGGSQLVSADGTHAVIVSFVRGLAGPGDPTLDYPAGTVTTYIDDVSAGLSDSFPGEGIRTPVGVCDAGTEVPAVDGSGDVGAQGCASGEMLDPRGIFMPKALQSPLPTAISRDGSRVFFGSGAVRDGEPIKASCSGTGPTTLCPSQLYLRHEDPDTGEVSTRWISKPAVAGQDASLLGAALFEGAAPDGDKVYFRTASPLTPDDPNDECGAPCTTGAADTDSWDLYEYDFTDSEADDPGQGTLTRISAGPSGTDDPNVSAAPSSSGLAQSLRFLAEDGSRLLFATAAPLVGAAVPGNGTITEPGGEAKNGSLANSASNLYLYEPAEPAAERWRFVARLERNGGFNSCATQDGDHRGTTSASSTLTNWDSLQARCVWGSPDGALIAFMTGTRLVAGDADASSTDVYAFDAEADQLSRVSAPQEGGAGGLYECSEESGGAPIHCHGDMGIGSNYRLGVIAEPGGSPAALFQSKGRLLPADKDDHYDVYSWREGELELISTGTATPAYYTGASKDGRNVFFMTSDRLTWQDVDSVRDIYTARIGGGIPEPPAAPAACDLLGGACQAAPAPAPPATQAASTAPGAGNVPASRGKRKAKRRCARGKVRRKGRCVARKSAKRKRAARHGRRAGK